MKFQLEQHHKTNKHLLKTIELFIEWVRFEHSSNKQFVLVVLWGEPIATLELRNNFPWPWLIKSACKNERININKIYDVSC